MFSFYLMESGNNLGSIIDANTRGPAQTRLLRNRARLESKEMACDLIQCKSFVRVHGLVSRSKYKQEPRKSQKKKYRAKSMKFAQAGKCQGSKLSPRRWLSSAAALTFWAVILFSASENAYLQDQPILSFFFYFSYSFESLT